MWLHPKNRNILQFHIKLRKPHSGPILETFAPKTWFLSQYVLPDFQPSCYSNFTQNIEKVNASTCYKTRKTRFGPLFFKKPHCRIFLQKSFESIKSLGCCNFMQKVRKILCKCSIHLLWTIPEKCNLRPILSPFCLKNLKTSFSSQF